MSVSTTQVGDLCITTKVLSASELGETVSQLHRRHPENIKKCKNLHMKTLGTVLILVGVLQLSLGTILNLAEDEFTSLTVHSKVYIWDGLMLFVAGCITVALEIKETIRMIKTCIGFQILNAVFGGVALILFIVQIDKETNVCWKDKDENELEYCTFPNDHYKTRFISILRIAVNTVSIVFLFPACILSIIIIALGWKVLKSSQYLMLEEQLTSPNS